MVAKKRTVASGAKKAKKGPSPDDFRQFYSSTLQLVNELTDENTNAALVDPFLKLPSKKLYPDYFSVIADPICIGDIQKKVSKNKYSDSSVDEFVADFKLLLDNASLYNDPESWIVRDASRIFEFVKEQASQFDQEEKLTFATLPKRCQVLLQDVIDHKFPEVGVVSGPFLGDVDKKEYPDYFKMIKHPTSFNKVMSEVESKKLFNAKDSLSDNLEKFHDATMLIFRNAQTYNDPSSLIHQDSLLLQEYFQAKYDDLKQKVAEPALKLKVKPPKKEPKLTLKLKSNDDEGSKKKRRKVEVKEESENDEEDEEEDGLSGEVEVADPMAQDDEEDSAEESKAGRPLLQTMESNVMGKTDTLGSTKDVFITHASVFSPISAVNHLSNNLPENAATKVTHPSKAQQIRKALFPSHPAETISTLFEYKFASNGYCSQSYTISLPAESSPYISFKFLLHDYLQQVKQQESVDAGYSKATSEEEFTCSLFVNDDEVLKADEDESNFQYDLKLNYGLNIVTFECKVAPNVSKMIKKTQKQPESEEVGGRHTRHQLQQLKRSWEVEKYNFFIVCNE